MMDVPEVQMSVPDKYMCDEEVVMNNHNVIELSVVVPILNEAGNLEELYRRLRNVLEKKLQVTYEIIFVDDGSNDDSWRIVEDFSRQKCRVKGLKFSRNFGHQHALKAGLDNSLGRAVVSIDGDLQQPPELIEELYAKWREGYKVVNTVRNETKGISFSKRLTSNIFYWGINRITDTNIEKGAADFRLLDREVVEQITRMKEGQLFLRGLINWLGYRSTTIEYVADERFSGETKYSLGRMLFFAVAAVMSFSVAPLRVAIVVGFLISLMSFVYAVYVIVAKLVGAVPVPGWTTTTFVVLFIGGFILVILGFIGEYIAKIYEEVRRRPTYIIDRRVE